MLNEEEIRIICTRLEFLNDQLAKFIKYNSHEQAKNAREEIELIKSQLAENTGSSSNQPSIPPDIENSISLELSDLDFYRWVFKDDDMAIEEFPNGVATDGNGPFELDEFDDLIKKLEIKLYDVGGNNEVVILGKNEWDADNLNKHIENRRGQTLRVYSQEMFFAQLLSGRDPYEDKEILKRFAKGHPALEYLIDRGFYWPETMIVQGDGFGDLDDPDDWPDIGLLKHLGYQVGSSGKSESTRQGILTSVFTTPQLPKVQSLSYMAEWGEAKSSKRLHKMADSIASFARNAKKRSTPHVRAIEDWEEDLEWLKEELYHGSFVFKWPSTYVH